MGQMVDTWQFIFARIRWACWIVVIRIWSRISVFKVPGGLGLGLGFGFWFRIVWHGFFNSFWSVQLGRCLTLNVISGYTSVKDVYKPFQLFGDL